MILLDGFQLFSKDSIFLNRCPSHEIYNGISQHYLTGI